MRLKLVTIHQNAKEGSKTLRNPMQKSYHWNERQKIWNCSSPIMRKKILLLFLPGLLLFGIYGLYRYYGHYQEEKRRAEDENKTPEERQHLLGDIQVYLDKNLLPNNRMLNQNSDDLISQKMLKKYLIYSKRFIRPKLSEIDQNKITQFYADIDGHPDDKHVRLAMDELSYFTTNVEILGVYPADQHR